MELADVHRTQISSYERGEIDPQAEVLARLSRALGVSAEEFFTGVGWQENPPRLLVGGSRLGPGPALRSRSPHGSSAATLPFGG